MWATRTATGASYPELGEVFDGRDHSSVVYAVHKFEAALERGHGWAVALADSVGDLERLGEAYL